MVKEQPATFQCFHCGAQFQKWIGRFLECGQWGTIEKGTASHPTSSGGKNNNAEDKDYATIKTLNLSEIEGKNVNRLMTNVDELDRVLGGGLVPGSIILLGGEPGIGKSTLALQLASLIPHTIYISGEESVEQIKLRADRLKIKADTLRLGNATAIENIIATIKKQKTENIGASTAIIDSIKTIHSEEIEGETGNVSQVRACTVKLMEFAKNTGITIVLIGQVTKDGAVAGPKTLEHLVDTVLYLEGDQFHQFRILRAAKNRFGSTDEVGIFSMEETGLTEIKIGRAHV